MKPNPEEPAQKKTAAAAELFFQALQAQPYRFDFFQALRRIECLFPNQPRIGESRRPSDDPLRLAQRPSLAFASSTLASCDRSHTPPRLEQNFFGLMGPNGPLPNHLSEYAEDRLNKFNDPTFARFLDLFHHRSTCLFYRAWANPQPTLSYDRPDQDRFATYIGALFGLGMPALCNRDAIPDRAKLHYAGRLVSQARSAEGLQALLADYFALPVTISSFVGHWLPLSAQSQCRLGDHPDTGLLGSSIVVGERVWDCQHKFRICLGSMPLADYQNFLPGEEKLKLLSTWVKNYIGDELIWDLNLILKKEEVPPMQLGKDVRLGWTSWLTGGGLDRDADDLKLDVLDYEEGMGTE